MSYVYTTCTDELKAKGFTPCDTPPNGGTCAAWKYYNEPVIHQLCNQGGLFQPIQALVCKNYSSGEIRVFPGEDIVSQCNELHNQDSNWNFYQCYCCCGDSQMASVNTVSGARMVHDVQAGDEILAGSLTGTNLTWTSIKVGFSSGITVNEYDERYFLTLSNGQNINVTTDHVFAMASGKLIRVSNLKLGDDLLDASGAAVKLQTISLGKFYGTVHTISTDAPFDGTPNMHLINSDGLVSADHLLQMHFDHLDAKYKA